MSTAKKLIFSLFQLWIFLKLVLQGKGRFGPKVLECGWPGSKWQSKFLIVGSVVIPDSHIYLRVEDRDYLLEESPQRVFFQKLRQGIGVSNDYYFCVAQRLLDEKDLSYWFETKVELASTFSSKTSPFTPIGVCLAKNYFVIEDGAHRLALSSLMGQTAHRLSVSLWNFEGQ